MIVSNIEQINKLDEFCGLGIISITDTFCDPNLAKVLLMPGFWTLEYIFVDPGNPLYSDVDGVLYNKERTVLLFYPPCRENSKIVIPDGVEEIGEDAFGVKFTVLTPGDALKNIKFSNSLKTIGNYAFVYCINLEEIIIPAGVTAIGKNVFYGCSSLGNIYVEPSNQNYCSLDGVLFSKDMTELIRFPTEKEMTEYNIPHTVKAIAPFAFEGCTLEVITIPDSIVKIGRGAFQDSSQLKRIVLPEGLTVLEDYLFHDCHDLEELIIPNSISSIGNSSSPSHSQGYVFSSCKKLTTIRLPDSITHLSTYSFSFSSFTRLELPGRIKEIPAFAFYCCKQLIEVIISDGTIAIGEFAFADCKKLAKITIPKSVTVFCDNIFYFPHKATDSAMMKIYCYKDSAAHEYAHSNKIAFEYL